MGYALTLPDGTTATGWTRRRPITVTNSGSTLTDYQVQILLTSANFSFANAKSDGSDIRITDGSGNVIPYWLLSYDSVGQTAEIWAKVPSIAAGSSTLYVYYGHPSPSTFDVPPLGPWIKRGSILWTSASNTLPENIVFDPITNKYWMAYTPGGGVGLAWSTDLVSWTDNGTVSGITLASGSGSPCMVLSAGTWYIFYASGGPPETSIRCASCATVSGTYADVAGNPMVATVAATWEAVRTFEPYVFYDGANWRLLYAGDGGAADGSSPIEKVGQATASAITGPYTKDAGNPVIGWGTTGQYDSGTVADPYAYKFGSNWYVGYASGTSNVKPWSTAAAVTSDFATFKKLGEFLRHGSTGDPDAGNAHRGAIHRFGDTYYLPYTGYTTKYVPCMATMSAKSMATGFPPQQVFDFYDDFSADNTSWWAKATDSTGGSKSVSGGSVTISSGTGTLFVYQGLSVFRIGKLLEVQCTRTDGSTSGSKITEIGAFSEDTTAETARIMDGAAKFQLRVDHSSSGVAVNSANNVDANSHLQSVWFHDSALVKFKTDAAAAWESGNTLHVPVGDLKPILAAFGTSGNATTISADWIRQRSYADNDPTSSVGSEQAAAGLLLAKRRKAALAA